MKAKTWLLLALASFLGSGASLREAPKPGIAANKRDMQAIVDHAVAGFVSNPKHVGLSIGVSCAGKRTFYNYGRVAGTSSPAPTEKTIYEIASLTKSFTGLLLAQAVIDGKIGLHDEVQTYLGPAYANLAYHGRAIRLVDLANHTSGLPKNVPALPSGVSPREMMAQYADFSEEAFLREIRRVVPDTVPGTRFAYSNAGTQLLGIVLQRVYHTSYGQLVRRYITRPHHMRDTELAVKPRQHPRCAQGYNAAGEPMPELTFWRTVPAAGFLKSTTRDLLAYAEWNLNEQDPVVALAHQPTFRHTTEANADIGLCWFVTPEGPGERQVHHAGGSFGTTSYCLLSPAGRTGIVCLANDAGPTTEQELRDLSQQILAGLGQLSAASTPPAGAPK
ncbi:serine hydrolase domain-containing protein [Hymenobacter negativus]|uniref:Beta-lactamase family protein n=1 Tax=Hymenobacter negativus TaxID=2795026 RepID=A0ABS3QLJ1_9BACT|nr:serine hydrolase domain-containing protein [Hymenobacter negativus]MBO2012150.1 beta-lactamase family protein [Hymenobacter negativus]